MKKSLKKLNYSSESRISERRGTEALCCQGLSFRYPHSPTKKNVLHAISFTVNLGERVALVGPNGAGKSTLLKLIIGIEKSSAGMITIFDQPLKACRHRIAIVPQNSVVDWTFPINVYRVVMMGRYVHLGWGKKPQLIDREAVDTALNIMGISDLANSSVRELSGGQQQRVMLARALAQDADLFLLDEPLNHLDLHTQEIIFHTLERFTAMGKAVIVSTHDLGLLSSHFSRAIFLDQKIIADGPPDKVLTPQVIAQSYGFEFHKDYRPWTSS